MSRDLRVRGRWGIISLLVGCLALLVGACERPLPTDGTAAMVPLRITAVTVGTPISTLVVQVTAADIPSPLVFNLTVVNGVASGTIKIPPGPARTIDVTALDAQGNVTHEGSATIDVRPGQNPPLQIKLAPRSGHVPITVTFGNFGVEVTPPATTICVQATLQLVVTVTDVNGNAIADPEVGWATTNPAVATVSASGLVTAVSNGTATIVATYEGVAALSQVTVTGCVSTLLTGLEYPKGLWVRDGRVYLTETAGRNTTFGGKVRLLRYDVASGQLEELINNPENSDAVVVDGAETIYLTSYKGTIPGEDGGVSVARFDAGLGTWVETHLLDLAIASDDMFLDANGDIYIIGSSDLSNAASLYRLPFPNYTTNVTVVATGLGRAESLTKLGTDFYYSKFVPGEIRRLSGTSDQLLIGNVSSTSVTSDGTFLYYADFSSGRINRMNLTTGAVETIASGLATPQAVRFDAQSRSLYFLEGGTEGAQFKDGTLKVIPNLP